MYSYRLFLIKTGWCLHIYVFLAGQVNNMSCCQETGMVMSLIGGPRCGINVSTSRWFTIWKRIALDLYDAEDAILEEVKEMRLRRRPHQCELGTDGCIRLMKVCCWSEFGDEHLLKKKKKKKKTTRKIQIEKTRNDSIRGIMKAHCVGLDCMEAPNQIWERRRVPVSFGGALSAIVMMEQPSVGGPRRMMSVSHVRGEGKFMRTNEVHFWSSVRWERNTASVFNLQLSQRNACLGKEKEGEGKKKIMQPTKLPAEVARNTQRMCWDITRNVPRWIVGLDSLF